MKKFQNIIIIVFIVALISCLKDNKDLSIERNKNFPQWIKYKDKFTNQTSGIAFLRTDSEKNDVFILSDDIGELFYLKIKSEKVSSLTRINFSQAVEQYFREFPKRDFEEIFYDKYENKIYISIEGNGADYKKFAGIYELIFKNNDIFSGEVINVEKLKIQPEKEFTNYLANNIGYEGAAVDKQFLYLGLETSTENPILSDSTFILIVDKISKNIIKRLSTKHINVSSVCGLCMSNGYLLGIDRNRKSLFSIKLDAELNIKSHQIMELKTNIPGFDDLYYIASLESITIDDSKNIYIVDDPWKSHYIPTEEILSKTNSETRNNFNKFIPVIYKYKITRE